MHDLIITGGTVVDGTGQPPFTGDVAVTNGRITGMGKDLGLAKRTLKADGLLVTPGWVDVHTHYDGQVVWDPLLAPSIWHGVTTVVMGNCGVGFAPVHPTRREYLITMMESVEDIPRQSLSAGINWQWETFPEYLDALSTIPRTLDVGTQVPHAPLRLYVMGERGASNEPATAEDIERMAAITRAAIEAGALGFSTSRTMVHATPEGVPIPGTFASEEELLGIARGVTQAGRGLMEIVTDAVISNNPALVASEMGWMRRVAAGGCPVTFLLAQTNLRPQVWRELLQHCETATRDGAPITPQVFARPVTILFSFQGEHPFQYMPSYAPLKDLPHAEKMQALRNPDVRRRLLAEEDPSTAGISIVYKQPSTWQMTFPMGQPLNYFPDPQNNVAAIAARRGCTPREAVYDLLLERDGRAFLMYTAAGYAEGNRDSLHAMLTHPLTVMGGSDSGAHMRFICDVSAQTFMLTNWVRDCAKGDRYHLPVEFVVKKQTHDTARLYGLDDRGALEPGMKADVNLIDLNALSIDTPTMINDLPAGMPRLMQKAQGYVATLVSGEVVQENGAATGARPGKVVRGSHCTGQR
jgi:N-acyl-D-aspartate/D-glutamate deacylase